MEKNHKHSVQLRLSSEIGGFSGPGRLLELHRKGGGGIPVNPPTKSSIECEFDYLDARF